MVMRFFRKHFAFIIWFTIIVFVLGFVILSTLVYIQKNKLVAFKVGKTNYTIHDYMERLDKTRDLLAKQNKEGKESQLKKDVLDSMINEAVLTKFAQELNIAFSKKDIMSYIQEQKVFQKNGQFDYNQYVSILRENGFTPALYESQVRAQFLYKQIYNIITKAQAVSPLFLLDQQRSFNEEYSINFVKIPTEAFKEKITISDSEIKNYYSKHLEDYFIEPRVKIAYKVLPIQLSKKDIDAVINQLNEIRKKILDKKLTFEEAAKLYSEGPSADKGGDLGWFDRKTMVKEFSDVAFSLKKGEISKPFKTKFGYHIVLVEDKKKENGKEKIKARHILIKPQITEEEKEAVSNKALEIYAKLKKEKLTDLFKDAIVTDYIQSDSLPYKEMSDVFDYKKNFTPGYPFLHKEKDKSAYVVYQLLDRKEGHYIPIKEIKSELKKKVFVEKLQNYLEKNMKTILGQYKKQMKSVNFKAFEGVITEIFQPNKKDTEQFKEPSKEIQKKLNSMIKNDTDFIIFDDNIYLFTLIQKKLPALKVDDVDNAKSSYFYNFIVNSTVGDFLRYLRHKYNVIVYKDRLGL